MRTQRGKFRGFVIGGSDCLMEKNLPKTQMKNHEFLKIEYHKERYRNFNLHK